MEFKSKKIIIDQESPYENDRLSRKSDIDNLSLLLRNISTPIVLSVNAPWGSGKTTFLEMLHADLMNKECKSIYFSSWETDFASDPLLAFLGEMNEGLEALINGNEEKSKAWDKAKQAGIHIVKKGIPALIKVGTAGVIDAEKILETEASKLTESLSKDLLSEYTKNKSAITEFKKNISTILSNDGEDPTKLYFFVDELDRCRPTYAIELLERIKHLLNIDGVVFILAMDKEQLSHGVKAVYGNDFESIGYLRRFIDIEYSLPKAEPSDFIDQLYKTFQFDSFFEKRKGYRAFQYEVEHLKNVFKLIVKARSLSLREIEQLFSKVNLVIHSTSENTYLYPALLTFLLVVKDFNMEVYQDYIREGSTPEKMVSILYEMVPIDQRYDSFECALIEGFLIAAKNERYDESLGNALDRHNDNVNNTECDRKEKSYSNRVINIAESPVESAGSVNLKSIVSRIEMSDNFKFGENES